MGRGCRGACRWAGKGRFDAAAARGTPPPCRSVTHAILPTHPSRHAALQALLYTATALAYFLVNTLMPVVKPEAYHAAGVAGSQLPSRGGGGGGGGSSTQKHYVVLIAAGAQYALMWWLGHSSDLL